MRTTKILTTVFLAAFLLLTTDAIAKDSVYRWVDEDGVVHFGDQPADDANAEIVDIQSSVPTNTESASGLNSPGVYAQPPETSRAQKQRDERQTEREKIARRSELQAAECKKARYAVSRLEPSVRVMIKSEDGEVRRMDDNDRLQSLNVAKTYIDENCAKN